MQFWDNIIRYSLLKLTKKLAVIELTEIRKSEQKYLFNAVLLEKKKNNLNIIRQLTNADLNTLEEWTKNNIKKDIPVLLNIHSDKIISKFISNEGDKSTFEIINETVPNANPDDFYCQVNSINDKNYFIALTRKTYVDTLLENLKSLQALSIQLYFGPFSLLYLYKTIFSPDALNTYNFEVKNYSFSIREDDILEYNIRPYENIDDTNDIIQLGEETISSSLIIPFSLGFHYFSDPKYATDATVTKIKENNDRYTYKKLSKILLLYGGILFLILLATNSIFYSIYTKKFRQLQLTYSKKLQEIGQLQSKHAELVKKQQILEQMGLSKVSHVAFYSDQIIFVLPDNIYLRRLDIHPFTDQNDDNPHFNSNKIIVEGTCFSTSDLNDWINLVKKYKWVKSIMIKDFRYNKGDNTSAFSLELIKEQL